MQTYSSDPMLHAETNNGIAPIWPDALDQIKTAVGDNPRLNAQVDTLSMHCGYRDGIVMDTTTALLGRAQQVFDADESRERNSFATRLGERHTDTVAPPDTYRDAVYEALLAKARVDPREHVANPQAMFVIEELEYSVGRTMARQAVQQGRKLIDQYDAQKRVYTADSLAPAELGQLHEDVGRRVDHALDSALRPTATAMNRLKDRVVVSGVGSLALRLKRTTDRTVTKGQHEDDVSRELNAAQLRLQRLSTNGLDQHDVQDLVQNQLMRPEYFEARQFNQELRATLSDDFERLFMDPDFIDQVIASIQKSDTYRQLLQHARLDIQLGAMPDFDSVEGGAALQATILDMAQGSLTPHEVYKKLVRRLHTDTGSGNNELAQLLTSYFRPRGGKGIPQTWDELRKLHAEPVQS